MFRAIAMLLAASAFASPAEVVDFLPGEALEVRQRADDTLNFRIELEAGRFYLLEVEQRQLDVLVEVEAPDGTRRSLDAPLLRFEPERVLIQPQKTGLFLISLSSQEYKGSAARGTLMVSELPHASDADQRRLEALAAETRAAEANHAGGHENWQAALDAYRSASRTWVALAEAPAEARARLAVAWLLYFHAADWQGAAREAEAVAALYAGHGNRSLHASALHVQGAALMEAAELDRSLVLLELARQLKDELGETYERARIVNDIGLAHFRLGDLATAQQKFEQAAQWHGAAGEWAEELKATSNLAGISFTQGHLAEALAGYQRTLELLRPGELSDWRAQIMDNMGAAHRALGNIDEALAAYAQALMVHEEHDAQKHRGRSLSGIGATYYGIGELDRAREYLERALPVRRAAQDQPGEFSTLLFLGSVYLQQGDVAGAIATHQQALQLAASPRERARAEVMLGRDLAAAGRSSDALEMLDAARSTGLEAGTPVAIADALLERGRLLINGARIDAAVTELQAALEIYENLGWMTGEAQVLHELARAARAGGELVKATVHAEASIGRTEQLRGMIVNPELRASFLATQREPYFLYIDIAIELAALAGADQREWLARALAMSERARTRAMLDLIHEASAGVLRSAEGELAARRSKLYQALAGLRFRQSRLLERERDPSVLVEARASLSRIETELDVLESELRRTDPRHAALTVPRTLDAQAIQHALDDDTMLLQYELGEQRSWLFVVSRDSLAAYPLPPRAEIEAMVREAYQRVRTLDPGLTARRDRDALLAGLSDVLLGPARPFKPRLVLATDGALHYLPFASLPLVTRAAEAQPLIHRHELVSVPSISVVASQRALLADRRVASKTVAVFADPVFESDDPRLSEPRIPARTGERRELLPSQWSQNALPRLPATGAEAEAIAALVSPGERLVATGLDANRGTLMNADLGMYRVLHFATHALVDDRYPALSALALSRFNAEGEQIDEFLRLHDVYTLNLGADLVTLSACETALGREVRGEGMLGLTRAFLHAGGSSVVASLWQVPDRATAELMRQFYARHLRSGLSPAAALRKAQLAVAAERRWRDPYYWAAFVTYGEWTSAAADATPHGRR